MKKISIQIYLNHTHSAKQNPLDVAQLVVGILGIVLALITFVLTLL